MLSTCSRTRALLTSGKLGKSKPQNKKWNAHNLIRTERGSLFSFRFVNVAVDRLNVLI